MTILTTRVLQKIDPDQHAYKYYRLLVAQDGDTGAFSLIQEYGRIGNTARRVSTPYPTEDEARAQLDKLLQAKQKRGYALLPDATAIPATYEALPCPWCQLLQPGQAHQVTTMTHSALYLRTSSDGSPALLFVYRHHVPSLSHLDAASLLGFLAEIRRVQGQAKDFLQQHLQAPWVQLFGGSEHLWCQLGPLPAGIEAATLQSQTLPDSEHLAALRQALTPAAAAGNTLAESSPQSPGQLSLLDFLEEEQGEDG